MPKLEVISSCLVQSASSSIAFSRLELTPWDLQLLLVDPIQKGLLFHKPESQQLQETIIDHLKTSFSRTLNFFPPLAGRLGTVAHDDNTTCFSSIATTQEPSLLTQSLVMYLQAFARSTSQRACRWLIYRLHGKSRCRRWDFFLAFLQFLLIYGEASYVADEVLISLSVGARARIPLPEGYFGNAVVVGRIGIVEADLLRNGLGFVGLKINEFITKHNSEAAIKFLENWVKNPVLFRKGRSNFVVSSSPRYNVYGNDFGWGNRLLLEVGKGKKWMGRLRFFRPPCTAVSMLRFA
ncbi:hypothetical protein DH2020_048311 [Rehmannia glutinosa]|uniref:Uncharacterized protein n=1 Tax=Rehmannia glutinosa TaxID=99300 RepID=A0ABR0U673_REHGL